MTAPTSDRVSRPSDTVTGVGIPGFPGAVIAAEHADCHEARADWNGAADRRPRIIARCTGTAAAAVRFARHHDLEIAVRGGGHNVAGTALCNDGIVVRLAEVKAKYDPDIVLHNNKNIRPA